MNRDDLKELDKTLNSNHFLKKSDFLLVMVVVAGVWNIYEALSLLLIVCKCFSFSHYWWGCHVILPPRCSPQYPPSRHYQLHPRLHRPEEKLAAKKNFEPTTRFPSSVSPYTLFSPPWSVIVHISPSVSPLTANPLACFKRDHQKLFTLKSELLYVPCSISHSGLLQQYQCNSVPWNIILYHAIQGPGNQAKYSRINFLLRPSPLWVTFISKGKKRATEQLEPAPVIWWYI